MSNLEIPITPRSEIIERNAYEARMHFLKSDSQFGTYQTLPGMVMRPTAGSIEELPYRQHPGMLLWVDFEKTDLTGERNGDGIPLTKTHRVGEIVVASAPYTYRPYSELMEPSDSDKFIRLWLGCFAMDRTRDSFGNWRHPLYPVYDLYKRLDIPGRLAEVEARAKAEQWDPKINTRKTFVAMLLKEYLDSQPKPVDHEDQVQNHFSSLSGTPEEEKVA